jgi:hypothetical protein
MPKALICQSSAAALDSVSKVLAKAQNNPATLD